MNLYILAEFPFALKSEGRTAFKNVTSCEIEVKKDALVEVIPLDGTPARCFLPDEAFFRKSSPDAVKVRLRTGGAVKFEKRAPALPFAVLFQKKLKNAQLTAYTDGCYKFSIEIPDDYRALSFKEKISDAGEFAFKNARFFYVYTEKKRLVCFSDGRLKTVFDGAAEEYSFEGAFVTKSTVSGTARTVRAEWDYDGEAFRPQRAETESAAAAHPLCDQVLPYVFAEAALAGDDLSAYLSADLAGSAHRVRDYLGKFVGVFPPPRRENDIRPALLYRECEGVYAAKYLNCEIAGGKIVNLTLI